MAATVATVVTTAVVIECATVLSAVVAAIVTVVVTVVAVTCPSSWWPYSSRPCPPYGRPVLPDRRRSSCSSFLMSPGRVAGPGGCAWGRGTGSRACAWLHGPLLHGPSLYGRCCVHVARTLSLRPLSLLARTLSLGPPSLGPSVARTLRRAPPRVPRVACASGIPCAGGILSHVR